MYIKEVERQLDKKVKIIRSDRGGENYMGMMFIYSFNVHANMKDMNLQT